MEFVFRRCHWLGFDVFSAEHTQDLLQTLSVAAGAVFERSQRITTHKRMEVVYLVSCELIVDFESASEQIFKPFKFLWFFIEGWHWCSGQFGPFWSFVDVYVAKDGVAIACQLLKGLQNLICFNFRRDVVTAEFWLTCGARILLFSWRSLRGAVGFLFLNSNHQVRALFLVWISWIASLTNRELHFDLGSFWKLYPVGSQFSKSLFRGMSVLAGPEIFRQLWAGHSKYVTPFG